MTRTTSVPLPELVELANYKVGSLISDLELLKSALAHCRGDVASIQEYAYRQAEGFGEPDGPGYGADQLARLVAFGSAIIDDVGTIREHAESIRDDALMLFHEESHDHTLYLARLKDWHEEELRFLNREAA